MSMMSPSYVAGKTFASTGTPALPAQAPVDPGAGVADVAAGQSWGDVLKGVVGNPNFMPAILMATMMAGKGKNKMGALLPLLMMAPGLFQGKGQTATPTAPAPLPAAT